MIRVTRNPIFVALLVPVCLAHAGMTLESRLSSVTVSTYGGSVNPGSFYESQSTTSFDSWSASIQSTAGAFGSASQSSWLTDSTLFMSGHTAIGGGAGHGGGQAPSRMVVEFTLHEFHSFSYVGEVTQASFGYASTQLTRVGGPVVINSGFIGNQQWSGTLEPGRYELITQLNCSDVQAYFYGSATFTVAVVPSPHTIALLSLLLFRPCHRRR